ncbi:phenylalanine--tRNA ligase subunit beta [Deinococcus irradiatisoli]|uniref:Phenylalanine--tRNA ligase beta subunit n=1 Tax=Deinococcus irradiatisoli TaxID=2202254 RepID=A0A2Z3JFI6_9DEIO|nr:phenylalanine--tRNA ligase subunit beta [Deinococcus irradiatisoli]AWN22756.1 phenylalanine--tRNA ligase subunit beta [Deinococcus irradiatisoli]
MKLPYSWLKELVPQLPPVDTLEATFAQLGLPLEGIEASPPPPEGVLMVTVTEASPMPGTQLTKLSLDVGQHGSRTIASGAPNAVGMPAGTMLALVIPGTRLGETEYGVRMLQGVESWGMAASAKELGIGESSAGLLAFPAGTAAPGTPMRELWTDDQVLDIEVTPNRADALSALGVARDVAAFLKLDLKAPSPGLPASGAGQIEVTLPPRGVTLERDPTRKLRFGCDHFSARTVSGVPNGPAPLWMQRRLTLCGMRPIDLIVDASNYVMLELGQPTALYDRRDVTNDRLLVSFGLRQGERVRDLLGGEHEVGPEDLLILDGRERGVPSVAEAFQSAQTVQEDGGVLGIAGIMGGDHGHVRADTSDVVIESAHFDPVLLRRTAGRLGLKTDAVYRYERGVDPLLSPRGANRVAELLVQCGGVAEAGLTSVGTPEVPAEIQVTAGQVRGLLGMDIAAEEMADILTRLGAQVRRDGDALSVTPPSWRVDMVVWQDLAEEVARLHGYAELPETLPTLQVHPDNHGAGAASAARRSLKGALMGLGAQEVVTYTFTSDAEAELARSEAPSVKLQNPLTADRTGLRTALYPSLLKAAQNRPKGERTLLFELGRVFPASGEAERLGLLLRGPLAPGQIQPGIAGSFPAFKGLVEALAANQGASFEVRQLRGEAVPPALHPGIAGEVVWNGQAVGWLGALHPEIAQNVGLKGDTYLLEVSLPLPSAEWTFRDPSRAPAAWRDLAITAPQDVSYGEVAALLKQEAGPLLESVEPFDVYVGEQIPEGQRSVAVRLTFRGEKTLNDSEVDPIMERLIAAVRTAGWDIRDKA